MKHSHPAQDQDSSVKAEGLTDYARAHLEEYAYLIDLEGLCQLSTAWVEQTLAHRPMATKELLRRATEFALREMLLKDAAILKNGGHDGEDETFLSQEFGLSPQRALRARVHFNALSRGDRQAFFSLLRDPINAPSVKLVAGVRRALEAILGQDDKGLRS